MITLVLPVVDLDVGLTRAHVLEKSAGCDVDVRIVHDFERNGYTPAVNKGLQWALDHGTDACICVDDCDPLTNKWLHNLKVVLDSRDSVWFTGPSGPCRTPPQNTGVPHDGRSPQYVSHLAGFCLLIAHEALEKNGLLNPKLKHYGSDVDYQWRARKIGGRSVWVPYVYMDHELHAPSQPAWDRDNKIFNQIWH